jgi:hypothetical protein
MFDSPIIISGHYIDDVSCIKCVTKVFKSNSFSIQLEGGSWLLANEFKSRRSAVIARNKLLRKIKAEKEWWVGVLERVKKNND